jgi:hypothetical protein
VVSLSALRIDLLYPPGYIPVTHLFWGLGQPQCHIEAGTIMPMKNLIDTIGNRTSDLPACSAMPQSTTPKKTKKKINIRI